MIGANDTVHQFSLPDKSIWQVEAKLISKGNEIFIALYSCKHRLFEGFGDPLNEKIQL